MGEKMPRNRDSELYELIVGETFMFFFHIQFNSNVKFSHIRDTNTKYYKPQLRALI